MEENDDKSTTPSSGLSSPSVQCSESESISKEAADVSDTTRGEGVTVKEKEMVSDNTQEGVASFHSFPLKETSSSSAAFTPIPYFDGEDHGNAWPTLSRNGGERQGPTLKECGLMASDLGLPTMVHYTDPELAPKTPEEWLELFKQSFDDLDASSIPLDKAQEEFARRAELERTYFKGGEGISMFLRPRHREKDPNVETRFQFRYTSTHFGLATRVVSNTRVEEIYGRIADAGKMRDFRTMAEQIVERINKTTTAKECDNILELLRKLKDKYTTANDEKSVGYAERWIKYCSKRQIVLFDEEKKVADKGKEEEEEEDDETETPVDTGVKMARTGEKKPKETIARPCHVIGHKSVTTVLGRDVPLLDKDVWPDVAPNVAYMAPRKEGMKESRYDCITDETIHGTLYGVNTLPSATSKSLWRNLKTKIQIPCSFDGRVADGGETQEALVVDHDRIFIVNMPTGEESGEMYRIPRAPSGRSGFKVVGCSLSEKHILVMGYRVDADFPSIMVIQRHPLPFAATFFCSDIPMACAILSETRPDTFLLGMLDGTILRVNIPTTWAGSISRRSDDNEKFVTIYPPKKKLGADVLERVTTEEGGNDNVLLLKGKNDRVLHTGDVAPVTRLVERGRRILASSFKGLHLFRLFAQEKIERRVTMTLEHNASYDFRGNLLVIHKENNSIQLVQLHECTLEAALAPPSELQPPPSDMTIEISSIAMHDQAITVFHGDGTRRILEMREYTELKNRPLEDKVVEPEVRAQSFLADADKKATKKKKKKGGKKKKKSAVVVVK
jgi:hypothetical protein